MSVLTMQANPTSWKIRWSKRHIVVLILFVAYLLAYQFPQAGLEIRQTKTIWGISFSFIHSCLAILLLNLGLCTTSFRRSAWNRSVVVVGKFVAIRCLVTASLVGLMWTGDEAIQIAATGILLVAIHPAAGSSAGWSTYLRANTNSTVVIILASTLLCLIFTPLIGIGVAQITPESVGQQLTLFAAGFSPSFAITWIVVPTLLGILIRKTQSDSHVHAIKNVLHFLSPAALILLNYSNGAVGLPRMASEITLGEFGIIVAFAIGCWVSMTMLCYVSSAGKLANGEQLSLFLTTTMSNTGLALLIATSALPDLLIIQLILILYTFVQHFGAAIVGIFTGGTSEPQIESCS